MREIKARAWDGEDKECAVMVYSDRRNEKDYQIEYEFTFDKKEGLVCRWFQDYDDCCGYTVTNRGTLDNIMLGTGVEDRNGTEIYEGDILEQTYINSMTEKEVKKLYKIVSRNGCYWAIALDGWVETLVYFVNDKCKVIGNIYENPELLEVREC